MAIRSDSFTTLEIEREGAVMRVWLNRPKKLNALNGTVLTEIERLFTELQSDFETRVVVLGGRGSSFSAGADRTDPPGSAGMSASADTTERQRRYASQLGRRACQAVEHAEAVTIARVHGHAIGGGFVLAMACDLRVASHDALFHMPEVDLGVPLTWGGTPRLIHELGAARAREIILMCDRIDSNRAEAWGIVNRSVPLAELDDVVSEWAKRIANKPEVAVHMTKTQFRAYRHTGALGDVSETDGDVLMSALRSGAALASFRAKDS